MVEEQVIGKSGIVERALKPNSSIPRPFLKWAGSKRALLSKFTDIIPSTIRTYREPFLGSGAMFFLVHPDRAVLSDTCGELIESFIAVRDNPNRVLAHLEGLPINRRVFYGIRGNRSPYKYKRAAEFIYLNKTCWNGLYRVNASGTFNVPFGSKLPKRVAVPGNIRECAKALEKAEVAIRQGDFEENLAQASRGDLVYLDPPYVTSHNDNGFIEYNEVLFSWKDQERLAVLAEQARKRGARVIVSNAADRRIIRLYPNFRVRFIVRSSTLASDTAKRREVREAIIFSQ